VFIRATADSYNDGDRNEAFHVSEKLPMLEAAVRQHNEALESLLFAIAMARDSAETACPAPVPQDCQARAEGIAPDIHP
jgi:hypothetical protein